MNDRLVVIPTYNEVENIYHLIGAILRICDNCDILVVDDNSPDGTAGIVNEWARKDARVRLISRDSKDGIGPAYIAGFLAAIRTGYDYILQMDADLSHDPAMIPALFDEASRSDLVIGSRYVFGGRVERWSMSRRLVSRLGSLYAKTILQIPVNDLTGGFKCFRRPTLEAINLSSITSRGYAFQIETTYRAYKKGFKIKEIPIVFTERREGQTKMSGNIFIEAIVNVWKFRKMEL